LADFLQQLDIKGLDLTGEQRAKIFNMGLSPHDLVAGEQGGYAYGRK